jgi:hypothetical protein
MPTSAQDIVNELAGKGASHFHASYVAKKLGVSTDDAHRALAELGEQGLVDVHFDVICPENDRTIASYKLGEKIPYGEIIEERTGDCEPFELDESNVLITYSPSGEFMLQRKRDELHEGSKKKNRRSGRVGTIFSTLLRRMESIRPRGRSSRTSSSTARGPKALPSNSPLTRR